MVDLPLRKEGEALAAHLQALVHEVEAMAELRNLDQEDEVEALAEVGAKEALVEAGLLIKRPRILKYKVKIEEVVEAQVGVEAKEEKIVAEAGALMKFTQIKKIKLRCYLRKFKTKIFHTVN